MPDLLVQIKSAFDQAAETDGLRVFIEKRKPTRRRWGSLRIDRHAPELAPSADVWRLLSHDPETWAAFRAAYEQELAASPEAQRTLSELRLLAYNQHVTLIYSKIDTRHNPALVVRDMIELRHHSHKPPRGK